MTAIRKYITHYVFNFSILFHFYFIVSRDMMIGPVRPAGMSPIARWEGTRDMMIYRSEVDDLPRDS